MSKRYNFSFLKPIIKIMRCPSITNFFGRYKYICYSFLIAILITLPLRISATITVNGTPAQRRQIGAWLTRSLDTNVRVDPNTGTVTIDPNGGNSGARRLRDMINDPNTSPTIQVVDNDPGIWIGAWDSARPGDPNSTTSGTQYVDVNDLARLGNVLNSYGVTPDTMLIHEITEVYEALKDRLGYADAHARALAAESELMGDHNTAFVGTADNDYFDPNLESDPNRPRGRWYFKIRRPPGSDPNFVIVEYDPATDDFKWYKEKVPCNTYRGLIDIPDPDPKVLTFAYDFNLEHKISAVFDMEYSLPNGVAFDAKGNLYVTEDHLEGQDEIRIFTLEGEQIGAIMGPELVDPKGIAIDRVSGDIFVAASERVIRYNSDGMFKGSYFVMDAFFEPTDVAIYRELTRRGLLGDESIYDLYVTGSALNMVFHFSVEEDMDKGTFKNAFGYGHLSSPWGISIDHMRSIWVASTGNNRIYRFNTAGGLMPFGDREFFTELPDRTLTDVELVDYDEVYVVDGTTGSGALLLCDENGVVTNSYGQGTLMCPKSIAIGFLIDSSNLVPILSPNDMDFDGDGISFSDGDCNDENPDIYPGAPEIPDGIDNDCDGEIDEIATGINISGMIFNLSTGAPIAARVVVPPDSVIFSGNDGSYLLSGISLGIHHVFYNKRGFQRNILRNICSANHDLNINIALRPVNNENIADFSGFSSAKGHVYDKITGNPVKGFLVTLGGHGSVRTDENGSYSFDNVPCGVYNMFLRRLRYDNVTLNDLLIYQDRPLEIDIAVTPLLSDLAY